MAGIESFQQSGLKISPHRYQNGAVHGYGKAHIVSHHVFRCQGTSATSRTRARAITNDMEPLRSSLRSTADAGEYDSAGGVETRE